MKHQYVRRLPPLPTIAATLLVMGSIPGALASSPDASVSAPTTGASLVGGALPGGAIVSARSVMAVPLAGGHGVATPIGSDGAFKFVGLKPGQQYRVAITSTPVRKQTQGATFGEKVNAAAKLDIHSGMPNRISMNVTVARQNRTIDVDGAPIEVAVDRDGSLVGRVAAL